MGKIVSLLMSIITALMSIFGFLFDFAKEKNMPPHNIRVSELVKNIDNSVNKDIDNNNVMGAEILVNQFGENIFSKVYGTSSVGGEKLEKDAIYRIASMTKPITAAALLIEADRGHIDLYADVSDYLDGYENLYVAKLENGEVVPDKKAENSVKVYQLVSHTSGIGSGVTGEQLYSQIPLENRTVKSVAEYFSDKPLSFDPGTSQEYSTAAFDIAARIIEITSGLSYTDYLKVNIFDKLGMKDTTFSPTDEQWSRMIGLHDKVNGKSVNAHATDGCVFTSFPVTYPCAGGGLASTASDYMKFAEMLLNDGKAPDGTQVMSAEAVRLMCTPVVDDSIMSGSQKWGLGVRVITDGSYTLPEGSFGWSGYYGTHFWIDPENKIAAVYMKNSLYDGGAGSKTSVQFEKDVMKAMR